MVIIITMILIIIIILTANTSEIDIISESAQARI